ncbi:MAG: adenylate/guanylate cyclase domain-containing protein [Burkholderiales bacterium]
MPATAASILNDPMTWRRLRLACGLVLFTYVALHFAMHALGLWSFEAMQRATYVHDAVWHSLPGTWILYGAFAIHFSLALYALYARRSFRMGAGEWTRLALGFSIVPLIAGHFASGRYMWSFDGVDRRYDALLPLFFSIDPQLGMLQLTAMLVTWTHGCLGIHWWLRQRPWYPRAAPLLLAVAVMWPALALLGLLDGYRDPERSPPVASSSAYGYDDGYGASPSSASDMPPRSRMLMDEIFLAYLLLVAGVLAARGVRALVERRRGTVRITYPGGREVRVPVGYPVLEASRAARIPHASICGGRGRCTTCRVRVLRGVESLPPAADSERLALARLRAGPNVRLACQLRPRADVAVLPLLPADVTADDPRRRRESSSTEHFVAIMFVDIRRSTALFERRLPYDAVFLLNHYFDAVAGAVVEAGGLPSQFIGDGLMAIFGMRTGPQEACRQALAAARLVGARLDEMNRALAGDLLEPIEIGVGLHAGDAILGEIGYRDHHVLTAIGDAVHVASRLQDACKDYACALVVSEAVVEASGADMDGHPQHDIPVRGRAEGMRIRAVRDLASVGA